jgi:carboxypeptidase C (cathepsin A)
LDKYTQFATNPIYLFGESYAGHYIPAFSKDLLTNDLFSKYKANYKGVGIGDGLTQALNQVINF